MQSVLAMNGGSSSITFALFQIGEPLKRRPAGKIDRIGLSGTNLTFNGPTGKGWSASASHSSSTKTCTIWVGENVIAGQNEGSPTCN